MTKRNHIVEHEELMAYLDGELATERAIETAAHLESCRECQRLVADLREVSEMMMGWEVEAIEPDLGETLEAALGDEKHAKQRRLGAKRAWQTNLLSPAGLFQASAVAVVVLLILAVFTSSLLRSPKAAIEAAALARARAQVEQAVSVQTVASDSPVRQAGRNRTPVPSGTPDASAVASAYSWNSNGAFNYDSLNQLTTKGYFDVNGNLQSTEQKEEKPETTTKPPVNNGPMIVRTAELAVTTKDFDKVRSSVEEILKRHHGYVGEMNVNTPTGSARSLTAALRVPADGLEAVLADLKRLGRAEKESQTGEEVTQQYIDLQARLANAKHTEQRLSDILLTRTGKLSDVLAVEMQIGRVRGEIEQMEAERKNMKNQADFATLNVTISEDYKAELKVVPPSTSTQFRNAAVEGYRSLVDGIISILLWLLSAGPTLLVWVAILFFPVRILWKKLKPKFVRKEQEA